MLKTKTLSKQTRNNWLIDFALFSGAVVSAITGIYFLFLPVGGFQGGRNPIYGVTILFERETWDDLHTWFGIAMILAAVIHITIHWRWIVNMTKKSIQAIIRRERRFNNRSRFNVVINMLIGLSFFLTAISGIYFLYLSGGHHGVANQEFLFSRSTWDLIHTWAGIVLVDAAVVHFVIHWGWVVKVTGKMLIPRTIPVSEMKTNSVEA